MCKRFFIAFRFLGTVMMTSTLVADYTYALKQTFSSKDLFLAYIVILAFRVLFPVFIAIKNVCQKVCNRERNRLRIVIEENRNPDAPFATQAQHTWFGCLLYSVLPINYLIGSYRLLSFKNFPIEIGCGLAMDFFFYVLPVLFIQGVNGATMVQHSAVESGHILELSSLQTFCIMSKLNLIAELILELIIFLYELYKLHDLERHSINIVVRYSE